MFYTVSKVQIITISISIFKGNLVQAGHEPKHQIIEFCLSRQKNNSKTDYQTNSLNANLNEIAVEPNTIDGPEHSDENPQQENNSDNSLSIILQKMSSLERTVQEIKCEVGDNSKELKEIKDKVENNSKAIQEVNEKVENNSKAIQEVNEKVENNSKAIQEVNEKVDNNSKELKEVKGKVEKLDEKVEKLRTENGHIFEMIARNEIAKKHGQRYSEGFVIFDLNGLVRLSTPKEKLSLEKMEFDSQASVLEYRTNKIANHIFDEKLIDKFEKNLKRRIFGSNF